VAKLKLFHVSDKSTSEGKANSEVTISNGGNSEYSGPENTFQFCFTCPSSFESIPEQYRKTLYDPFLPHPFQLIHKTSYHSKLSKKDGKAVNKSVVKETKDP
jgi:hypothetical protein